MGATVEGVLLIDKPKGPSSFGVISKVRGITKIKRIGHAGTLDPLASGLLVVCLGRYTKLASFLTDDNKVYESVFRLGQSTTTDDAEGEIIQTAPWEHLTNEQIQEALASFVGKLNQVPPKFSAVKIDGKRAYALARADRDVVIAPRAVEVFSLDIVQMTLPDITVRIHSSKGTYIRSIARDLGQLLGCGAYARDIRRVKSGGFDVTNAQDLGTLDLTSIQQQLLCKKEVARHFECIEISEWDKDHVVHGRPLTRAYAMNNTMGLLVFGDEIIALVQNEAGHARVVRVF